MENIDGNFNAKVEFSNSFTSSQDVFLMVRRKKTTVFIDAKETTTVRELKRILQGKVQMN